MGFDKHFNEDHCYLEDGEHIAMNVEIMDDNAPEVQNSYKEKSNTSYSNDVKVSNSTIIKQNQDDVKYYIQKASSNHSTEQTCTDHTDMLLHEDEKLVKPGDKFPSHEDFVQYLNDNAKRWYFYYKCSDSRNPNTVNETYTYSCIYLKNKEKYKKKGLRKRNIGTKTDCPCKIKLRHIADEKELTVVYVCNHHDHKLSEEEFYKLSHGRRLPPYVKEEIMDFIALRLDARKIKAYVEMETGFSLSRAYFYTLERNMKMKNVKRYLTEERLNELREKINSVHMVDENTDDQINQQQISSNNDIDTPKTSKPRRISKTSFENAKNVPVHKRRSITADDKYVPKKCKLEDNSQISYSNETLQSVKNLQESVKCETQRNPWISDQCVPVLPERNSNDPITTDPKLLGITETNTSDESGKLSYTIHYYSDDDDTQANVSIKTEHCEVVNNVNDDDHDTNEGDYIGYETVVSYENNLEIRNKESNKVLVSNIVDDGGVNLQDIEQNNVQYLIQDEQAEISQDVEENNIEYLTQVEEAENSQDISESNVEYLAQDGAEHSQDIEENHIEYLAQDEGADNSQDIEESNVEYLPQDGEDSQDIGESNIEYLTPDDAAENSQDIGENDIEYLAQDEDVNAYTEETGNDVEYVAECDEDIVQYITESGEVQNGNDVGVQANVAESSNSLVPVFDVYMKDGNVTGFVVNNNLVQRVKDTGIDKEVQTIQELCNSDQPPIDLNDEICDTEIIYEKNCENTETYTKHEYVHRHNIDRYMTQPHFPRYIKILAKETNADVLRMIKNVYREKGMFKMTTTQRGKEGNTRIWYIREQPKFRKPLVNSDSEEIAALNEKIKALQKQNNDLVTRNKYLEDVALKLLNG